MASKAPGLEYFFDSNSGTAIDGFSASSDIETEAIDLTDYDGPWIVTAKTTSATGNPYFTIMHSYDATNWFEYDPQAKNRYFPESIIESSFKPSYMKISYTANGANNNLTLTFQRLNTQSGR